LKKKIGLFIIADSRAYPPTINAANLLSERGHDVVIFDIFADHTKDRINLTESISIVHLGFQQVGLKNFLQFISIPLKLFLKVKQYRLEYLLTYDAYSVLPAFLIKLLNRELIWCYHQHDFWESPIGMFQKLLYHLEYRLVRFADYVSFPQYHRSKIFVSRSKIKQNPLIVFNGPRRNWIDGKALCNQRILDLKNSGYKLIIYQGGLSNFFGLDRLIESLCFINRPCKLLILGKELESGLIDDLKSKAKKFGLENIVIFWNEYVSYDDLPTITSFCDVGATKLTIPDSDAPINDRYLAGASNKIIEYLACGLPIIAANSQDNVDFMGPESMGVFFDASSPRSIASAINIILDNLEFKEVISTSNRKLFFEKYCFDEQFEKVLNIIEKGNL
jgi:glycosyltransferase involved in cell wall biosynthesis